MQLQTKTKTIGQSYDTERRGIHRRIFDSYWRAKGNKSFGELAHEFGTSITVVNTAIARHINNVTELPAKDRRHDLISCAIRCLDCDNVGDAKKILERLKSENI